MVSTRLAIDLTARTGTATIAFAASAGAGASLEIGDLDVQAVRIGDAAIPFAVTGAQLDLAVGAEPVAVTIDYGWRYHDNADGVAQAGYTLTWPYYCGNVFPCRSTPADGTSFELALTGVPAGATSENQGLAIMLGIPASANVGTFGMKLGRVGLPTAMARTRPALMNCAIAGRLSRSMWITPPIRSVTAGALPL